MPPSALTGSCAQKGTAQPWSNPLGSLPSPWAWRDRPPAAGSTPLAPRACRTPPLPVSEPREGLFLDLPVPLPPPTAPPWLPGTCSPWRQNTPPRGSEQLFVAIGQWQSVAELRARPAMEGMVPATATAAVSTFQLILEHLCAILLVMSQSSRLVPALPVLLPVILVGALVVMMSLITKRRHSSGRVKAPDKRRPARDKVCAGRSENTGPRTEADDTPKPPGVEASPLWLQTLCLKALNEHLSRMASLQDLADLVRSVRRPQPPGHSCVTHEKPVTKAPGTDREQLQENMPGDTNKNTHHPESPELRQEETVGWKKDVQEEEEEEEEQGLESSTAPVEQDLQGADEEDQGRARELWEQKQISEELAAEIRRLQTDKASLQRENTDLNAEIQQRKLKLRVQPDAYEDHLTWLQKQVLEAERRCSEMEKRLLDDGRNMKSTYQMLDTYKKMAQDMNQELRKSTFYYEKEVRYHWERAEAAWRAAENTERKLQELWRENDRNRQLLARAQFPFQPFPGGPFAPAAPPAAYRGPEVPVHPLGPQVPRKE